MADSGSVETHEDALRLCLDDMEGATVLKLQHGLRDEIAARALPKFVANHSKWPEKRDRVRQSAAFIGRFAELFAAFDGAKQVQREHASRAIVVVRDLCQAKWGEKLGWCPDEQGP